jgi:hypothetical protein
MANEIYAFFLYPRGCLINRNLIIWLVTWVSLGSGAIMESG